MSGLSISMQTVARRSIICFAACGCFEPNHYRYTTWGYSSWGPTIFHKERKGLLSHENEDAHYFVGAVLFGIGDAFVEVMQGTLMCNYFPTRAGAAFANIKCWQSVGLAIALLYGPYLHASYKLYVVAVSLVISGLCINCLPPVREEKQGAGDVEGGKGGTW